MEEIEEIKDRVSELEGIKTKESKKFPKLSECEDCIRKSVSEHKLSRRDEHIIGTLREYVRGSLYGY